MKIAHGTAKFWQATLALCLGSFMVFANLYVTQPLLPSIANTFHLSPAVAGASFTIATLTLSISLLIYGPLSDAMGRRKLMIGSLLGIAIITLALSFTSDYHMLLVLRAFQGFFLAGLPAIAVAYMSDEFDTDALMIAVGIYISGNSLGGIAGRLFGGILGESVGLSNTFATLAAFSLLMVALFAWLLPKSENFSAQPLHPRAMLKQLGNHLRNPNLSLAYLIGGLSFFIFVNQYSYITFVLEKAPYSLSPKLLGLLFLTYLTGTYGSAISGKLARRWGQPECMMLGTAILAFGSAITLLGNIWAILLGLLINSFGFFLTHSTASSWVSRNAQSAKASASSLYLTFYYLGASLGGFYLAPFWHWAGWAGVVIGSWFVLFIIYIAGTLLNRLYPLNSSVTPVNK